MKNLIYFCFNDYKNFFYSKILLSTLNCFEKDYDILIISNLKNVDKMDLESYCKINKLHFFYTSEDDPYFLRYHVFKWNNINLYSKIFYVDCDVIFNIAPKYFFTRCNKIINIVYEYQRKTFFLNQLKDNLSISENWWGAEVAKKENYTFSEDWKLYNSGQFLFLNNTIIKKLFNNILYYKNEIGRAKFNYNFKNKYFPYGDQPLFNFFLAKNKVDFDDIVLTENIKFGYAEKKKNFGFLHYFQGKTIEKIFKILTLCKCQISNHIFNTYSDEELFLLAFLFDKKVLFFYDLSNNNYILNIVIKLVDFLPELEIFHISEISKIYENTHKKLNFIKYNFDQSIKFDAVFYNPQHNLDFELFNNTIKINTFIILENQNKNIFENLKRCLLVTNQFNEFKLKINDFDTFSLKYTIFTKNVLRKEVRILIENFKLRKVKNWKWLGDSPERIELISKLAKGCMHITEFGVYSGCSTLAFMLANPKELISYDITDKFFETKDLLNLIAKKNKINYRFNLASSLEVDIDETDMLFIDTTHSYENTKTELGRHHSKVKKHILLHDYNSFQGVQKAVDEFLLSNKNFKISYLDLFDDGMIMLSRDQKFDKLDENKYINKFLKRNNDYLSSFYKNEIAYGLFKGLKLNLSSWSSLYKSNKILGLYELQVKNKILDIQKKYNYEYFINLGADNGYYPLGFLKSGIFKKSIAFELKDESRKLFFENAKLNNLDKHLEIYSEANSNFLEKLKHIDLKKCLFLVDIEGGEYKLFSKSLFYDLRFSAIIIEDHSNIGKKKKYNDFKNDLIEYSDQTHDHEIIFQGERSLDHINEIQNLNDNLKSLYLSEGRPKLMRWLIFLPKKNF